MNGLSFGEVCWLGANRGANNEEFSGFLWSSDLFPSYRPLLKFNERLIDYYWGAEEEFRLQIKSFGKNKGLGEKTDKHCSLPNHMKGKNGRRKNSLRRWNNVNTSSSLQSSSNCCLLFFHSQRKFNTEKPTNVHHPPKVHLLFFVGLVFLCGEVCTQPVAGLDLFCFLRSEKNSILSLFFSSLDNKNVSTRPTELWKRWEEKKQLNHVMVGVDVEFSKNRRMCCNIGSVVLDENAASYPRKCNTLSANSGGNNPPKNDWEKQLENDDKQWRWIDINCLWQQQKYWN